MKLRKNCIDETNKIYGSLTVLYPIRPEGSRKIQWHCICKCGKEIDCYGSDLRSGKRTSCGSHCNSVIEEKIGAIYGFLTILEKDPRPARDFADNCIHYICECQLCGSIKSISGRNLRNGNSKSCGCSESLGEQYISIALNELNLSQEKEFRFDGLIGDGTNKKPLRFDFKVELSNNKFFLIEFQGIQHFQEIDWFKDNQKTRLKYDNKKLNQCKNNKINILYFNQKESRKFNGSLEEIKQAILNFIEKINKGEQEYEIFNYDL